MVSGKSGKGNGKMNKNLVRLGNINAHCCSTQPQFLHHSYGYTVCFAALSFVEQKIVGAGTFGL